MATTSDLSRGAFVRIDGELGQVMEWEHITPNKAPAFYHVKLRNIRTGKLIQTRFKSGASIDLERVELRELQYLYREGEALVCMDNENYEQTPIDATLFGEALVFIKEGMMVSAGFDSNETVVFAEAPHVVELEVTYTEPGIRGDTATNTLKPATLETGAEIKVPLFIDNGQKIKVDTRTFSYMERVK